MKQPKATDYQLRLDYLQAASYWFYRAETPDENLISALNRSRAMDLKLRLGSNAVPTDEEVRAWAVARWDAEKLHQESATVSEISEIDKKRFKKLNADVKGL